MEAKYLQRRCNGRVMCRPAHDLSAVPGALAGALGNAGLPLRSNAPFFHADHPVAVRVCLFELIGDGSHQRYLLQQAPTPAMRPGFARHKSLRQARTVFACPMSMFLTRAANSVLSIIPELSTSYRLNATIAPRRNGTVSRQTWHAVRGVLTVDLGCTITRQHRQTRVAVFLVLDLRRIFECAECVKMIGGCRCIDAALRRERGSECRLHAHNRT